MPIAFSVSKTLLDRMKNQLIRTALFSAAIFTLFLSCGKEKQAEYFIKFNVDGEQIEFKKAGFVVEPASDPDKIYIVIGGRSADNKDIFMVDVEVPKELQPATYDSETDVLVFSYGVSGAPSRYYSMYPFNGQPDPHFILTITSITETEIRGHFTGNYLADEYGNYSIVVPDGEFVAKLNE
jgi:hypothetical protein